MTKAKLNDHNDVLEALANEVEIPEHLDEQARSRYQSIGDWLTVKTPPLQTLNLKYRRKVHSCLALPSNQFMTRMPMMLIWW